MKITKSRLKQIIKEELEAVLDEARPLPEKVPHKSRPQSSTARHREQYGSFSRNAKERHEKLIADCRQGNTDACAELKTLEEEKLNEEELEEKKKRKKKETTTYDV